MQDIVLGEIKSWGEDGTVVIEAAVPDMLRAATRKYKNVEVGFCDGRHLSGEQRRKCYALLGEIADYVGDDVESAKETMKWDFILNRLTNMRKKLFSLSDCDMDTAREFITYLIDFIIEHGVPTGQPLVELSDDIEEYCYSCLIHKRCAVCGKPAELHHLDGGRVGMGNNRQEINHIGRPAVALCREHHTICHAGSEWKFMHDNHLQATKIDTAIAKVYRLKGGKKDD